MRELHPYDLRHVVERLPRDIRDLLSKHPAKLFVGGGFIRAVVAGEKPNDIDIFGSDPEWMENVARGLMAQRPGSRIHKSCNAITLLSPERLTVQFITRWTFQTPQELVDSLDFTICQAAIYRGGAASNSPWRSVTGVRFYSDLAARRLHYTAPRRIEEAGGSLLRVIKYVQRGYSIQVGSLGAVVARLATDPVVQATLASDSIDRELRAGEIFGRSLRYVDPQLQIDGLEVTFDHEAEAPINAGQEV